MADHDQYIAIIGSSCRFAGGASSPSKLWDLLQNPPDLSAPPPDTRFNLAGVYNPTAGHHGSTNIQGSYFLNQDPRAFDAAFFNISPKEAEAIDPQHRMLLELTFEAMESAGLTMKGLQGSDTSVHVGLMIRDYMDIQARDPDYFSLYMVTGTSSALNANRISYFFDWRGPSLTIDTACSSSLVAVHQAVQGLRSGESRIACVAGTNLLLGPELFISAGSMGMLSPRSRMWDESAGGYARGDGIAVFIMKTLSNAIADGDHIEAIIRETGVNSDGRTKGITLPNPEAQATLIRETYRRAGLDISKAEDRPQYCEAHGTGTQAGDPMEASAIHKAFFGEDIQIDDRDIKMWTGSIKTVVGHTEGTAGMAGMLKALLAMKHRVIPPNLHFHKLNPSVAPFYTHLQIPTEPVQWPEIALGTPLRVSVNSFGFGGTNAHIIMESYEPNTNPLLTQSKPRPKESDFTVPLLISAHSEKALRTLVSEYSTNLKTHGESICLRDLGYTLHSRRSDLPVKAFFSGMTVAEISQEMDGRLSTGTDIGSQSRGMVDARPCILGVFTGQGAQWPAMGKHLIENSRLFGETIDRLEKGLADLPDGPDWSLREEISAPKSRSRTAEATISQPLCAAIAIALVDLLRASGVTFSAVVGHSSGEIGAAYAAGVISATEAMQIAYYRGVYAELAEGKAGVKGAMLAVGLGFDDAHEFCRQPLFADRIEIAASNSPSSVTLSGDLDAIKEAKELLDSRGIFARKLQVDCAYHSHHMSPCAEPYVASLLACNIQAKDPDAVDCSWISSVYGSEGAPGPAELGSTYWRDNMTQTVLFSQAIERAMIECGPFDVAIEVGPHPSLKGPVLQTVKELFEDTIPYVGTLDRKKNDIIAFGHALASLWLQCGSGSVDFKSYVAVSEPEGLPPPALVKEHLPTYPWDHSQLFWRESRLSREYRLRNGPAHELLGHSMPGGDHEDGLRWRNILIPDEVPWIGNVQFQGSIFLPVSVFCSMALEAALKLVALSKIKVDVGIAEIQSLEIFETVSVPHGAAGVELISSIQKLGIDEIDALASAEFAVLYGPPDGSQPLKRAVSARVVLFPLFPNGVSPEASSEKIPKDNGHDCSDVGEFYASISDMGLEYDGPFRSLQNIRHGWRRSSAIFSEKRNENTTYQAVDPCLIESCIQVAYAAFSSPGDTSLWTSFLPRTLQKLTIHLDSLSKSHSWHRINGKITDSTGPSALSGPGFHAEIEVLDSSNGHTLIEIEELQFLSSNAALDGHDREIFLQTIWKKDIADAFNFTDNHSSLGEAMKICQAFEEKASTSLSVLPSNSASCPAAGLLNSTSLSCFVIENPVPQEAAQLEAVDHVSLKSAAELLNYLTQGDLRSFVEQHPVLACVSSAIHDFFDLLSHRFAQLNILEIGPSSLGPSRHGIEGLGRLFSSYTFAGTTAGEVEECSGDVRYTSLEQLSPEALAATFADQKFDAVIVSYALHGQTSDFMEKAVSGLRTIIKSGGYLLLIEPTMEYSWSRLFLNILLAKDDDNASSRVIGKPLSTVHLDQLLCNSDFSGIDSLLPGTDDEGPGSAMSLIITQALDERIDLYRRPLQPSAMSLVDDSRLLFVGGKTLRTHKAIQNIVLVLRHWTRKIDIVDSFDDFSLDSSLDYVGAIVLTDIDRPFVESLTSQTYDVVLKLFGKLSHILWVTSDALTKAPEQAASLGLCRSLWEEHTSVHLRYLDIDSLWGSEEKILSNFFRLLISKLPVSNPDERLDTDESWIIIKDGHEFIPRILPIQDMNDRLNSQRRIVKQEIPRGTPLTVIPFGSLDAATYRAQTLRAASIDSIYFSHSLPCAIKVYEDTYLYLFSGSTDSGGSMLGFSETLSLPGFASAIWKTCESTRISSDRLLEFASSLLAAQNICEILPAGHSVILEPSQIMASMILELTKDTEKKVHFMTIGAVKPADDSWVNVPAHASKRAISSVLPDDMKVFFNASSCSGRLVSKILENLPADTRIRDQSHIFSLEARSSRGINSTFLMELLRKMGSLAVEAAHRITDNMMLPRVSLSDLVQVDGIPRTYSGLSVIDWTQDTPTSTIVGSLCPAGLLSSERTYVMVDINSQLLQSIIRWFIFHGARKLIIIDKSNVERSCPRLPSKVSAQFIRAELTNLSEFGKSMVNMHDIAGVIYGGAGAHRSSRDEQGDTLQTWRNMFKGSRNLSECLMTQNPIDFFIILSSDAKKHAPVSAYLASLASQARMRGLAACFVDLSPLWTVSEKSNDSPYMRISESDLQYVLTEAISAAKLHSHDPIIHAGISLVEADAEISSHNRWLSQPLFSHHVNRSRACISLGGKAEAQSLQEKLFLCSDHDAASFAIQCFFLAKLAVLLNLPSGRIQPQSDLTSLGVDSLIASSIRAWFLKEVDADVQVFKILGGASISQLCAEVAANMTFDALKQETTPELPTMTTTQKAAFPPAGMKFAQLVEQKLRLLGEPALQYADAALSEGLSSPFSTGTIPTPIFENDSHDVESGYFGSQISTRQSLNQARLWFPSTYLDQKTPFNCTTSYTLAGPIDGARLHAAFQLLTQRHESFRTSFHNDEVTGESMQHILQSSPFALKVMMGNKTEDYQREFRKIHEYHFDLLIADTFIATLISHSPTEHTLITGYHHIIMDGVSWQITLNEVAKFYESDTLELPPLTQYIDFAIKQQQLIADDCHAQKLAYWKKEFPTAPVLTPLFPFAKVGIRKTLTRYDTVDIVLDLNASLVANIKKAALSAKSTSFHFYLAAYVVLMDRSLDIDEVCLGIVDANRSDQEFLNTIGFFINMLPLKLKVNKKERFQRTIENARKKVYTALEHSGVPFEHILKELRTPASPNHTPMFQALLNYRMGALRAPQMGDTQMTFLDYKDAKAPFDLTLSIDEKDDGTGMLTLSMQEYLYDQEAAELLASTYVHLLDTLSDDPSQRLNSVSLHSKAVSDRALTIGTGPIIDFEWPRTQTISQRVDWQTQQRPDRLAVKDLNGRSRTYLQTSKRVHALALALAKKGVSHGCRVAAYCEPSVDYIACLLSVHRVGATFVPLDVRNSLDRLRAVIQECNPTLVLYDSSTGGRLPGFVPSEQATMDISTVDDTTDAIVSNVSRLCDDAVILYTSGSTGKPKGIPLTQANIAIHCASLSDKLDITHQDVVLQQSALGFDAALGQMLYALTNGATLIVGNNRGDPRDLAGLMEKENVTMTLLIISEASALLQHASDILSRCVRWRGTMCGGEAFTGRLASQFCRLGLSDLVVWNIYGPTEGCVLTSICAVPCRDVSLNEDVKILCGPPLPNYGVYILDEKLQPVPLGWPGEICISGPCIASGYVGQPSLTTAKFKPDHLQRPAGPYEGWNTLYRTGDRARMLEDGSFIFLGRIDGDSQVKIRGIRIELGEITSAIIKASHGAISNAATIVRGREAQTLVSFIVFSSDYEERVGRDVPPKDFLRKLVHELPLPGYMRPAVAIPLKSLPITDRGKLDTKALEAYRSEELADDTDDQFTETEQKLKRVWQETLPEKDLALQITKQSDFFSVGGNSLLLIHLRAAIRNSFGVEIPLADLFQASTLESLAARLDNPSASHSKEEIDWDVEVALDPSLPAASACRTLANDVTEPQPITVILTGSTGFLGREITRQLIANPHIARIHCVAVRPGRTPPMSDKLVIHRGDLTKPLLGLPDSVAREVFSTASAIIHNGAEVSHMKTYQSMRAANVESTKELVSLALRVAQEVGVPVPSFHYISTLGVASLVGAPEFREVSVAFYPPAKDGSNGYNATKFASECFLEHASQKLGLPVMIHRPSNITGPEVQDQDIVHSVWRWSESMRAVPDLAAAGAVGALDFIGVENCAAGIISSVFDGLRHAGGHTVRYLHQSGGEIIPFESFQEAMEKKLETSVELLPFDEWIGKAAGLGLDELVVSFLKQTKGYFVMPLCVKKRDVDSGVDTMEAV